MGAVQDHLHDEAVHDGRLDPRRFSAVGVARDAGASERRGHHGGGAEKAASAERVWHRKAPPGSTMGLPRPDGTRFARPDRTRAKPTGGRFRPAPRRTPAAF
ncbi:hypothetical protein GCM10009416_00660 [Craurococcus roseus]|uniref:Uncharacterized protein n=1 Tax=Craurococcus roseus TaxID=77585 RepID=A0ABP3PI73_9PROT